MWHGWQRHLYFIKNLKNTSNLKNLIHWNKIILRKFRYPSWCPTFLDLCDRLIFFNSWYFLFSWSTFTSNQATTYVIARQKYLVCLFLIDPRMSNPQVIRQIKKNDKHLSVPLTSSKPLSCKKRDTLTTLNNLYSSCPLGMITSWILATLIRNICHDKYR